MMTHTTPLVVALAAACFAAACGSSAVPAERLTNTKAAIRAAEEMEARKTPRAALHLKLANDQVAKAERLIDDGENDRAKLYLDQAQADADLALGLAKEAKERSEAQQAEAKIQELRKQAQ